MQPVELRTERLVLSAPTPADVDAIAEYCRDPLFERFLTTPWPYRREHAVGFVGLVEQWWSAGSEFTFGVRTPDDALIGMIGWRARGDVGFWMGAAHRGRGYMSEALTAVVEWVFAEHDAERVEWEALPGNLASASVARTAGFRFTGVRPMLVPARDGSYPDGWHGELRRDDDRTRKPGWPL